MNDTIILASASPLRRDMLASCGFEVIVRPTDIDESARSEDPASAAQEIARQKMSAYFERYEGCEYPVLTADTVLGFEGRIIGKQEDRQAAHSTLKELSGKRHAVHTAAFLYLPGHADLIEMSDTAHVTFRELTDTEISRILDSGSWRGAAGSYRIQADGISLISLLEGDYFTVAGLPLMRFFGIVREQSQ